MKSILRYSAFFLAGSMLLSSSVEAAEGFLVDGVAAQVNRHTITVGDVMTMVAPVRRQLMRTYSGAELKQKSQDAFDEALQTLIARRLALDLYEEQDKLEIPEWIVDQRVNEIVHEMFSDDRAALMAALAEDHMTYDQWREGLREHIIVSYMRRLYVEDKITVSPFACRREYEENLDAYRKSSKTKLSMIMMEKGPSAETAEAKRQQALDVQQRLKKGADFAALARDVSDGTKAKDGGDWGWVELRILRPELTDAISSLKPNEISELIETDQEFYLLKVEGRQNEKVAPFESVQPEIERRLREGQSDSMYKAWVDRLRDKAFVKLFDADPFAEASE